TDATGVVAWAATYTPFGRATITTGAVSFPLRFPGQYEDAESGLHYNWHRYYDPATGRYMTSDPIGLAGGLNPYLYASANPIRIIDPRGQYGLLGAAFGAVSGAIGGYIASGGQFTGLVAGGFAGAIVGFVMPSASSTAGAAVAGFVSNATASIV